MRSSDERGAALILALFVLVLLAAVILQFDAEARRDLKEAVAFRDTAKATALAHAAVEAARAIIREDARLKSLKGQQWDDLTDLWAFPISGYRIGDGVVAAHLVDERGKLNLNDLSAVSPTMREERLARFKRLFDRVGVDSRLVDAIADWVDPDDRVGPEGAERGHYESLAPPYRPANGPLKSLGELLLIRGVTEEAVRRLSPYVTVYPVQSDGWINLNTADPVVIEALDPRITASMAQDIVEARPFKKIQDADKVTSFEPIAQELRLKRLYDVRTDHLSGKLLVTVDEVTKIAHAVLARTGLSGDTTVLAFRID